MKRITQKQDDLLLQYLDGTLTGPNKNELDILLIQDSSLKSRLEELRVVHSLLASKARLEQPSKIFIDRVMDNLDQLPARSAMSPKNGLLLLCGVLVAVGIMTLLLSVGVFDNMNSPIALDKLPVKNDFIKNPLPTIPFNAKWLINGILIAAMGLAFVLLDRTILKPYFDRRSRMQF